ncbi:MAG: DNA polymerase III subunit alpha [Spirochaetales bacterium]|nr:DNA polymerase III subunit alpha [Spirochaetales bacterium]
MPDFVHLHNHSDYSLLDGASPLSRMVKKAKTLGMKHLALTDHGNLFGALKFYKACQTSEIHPIIGCEFYLAPDSRLKKTGSEQGNRYHHLIALAKNKTGYKNLIALSSLAYTEGFYYKPRIDDQVLAEHAEGLIGSSSCLAGEIPRLILQGDEEGAYKKACYYGDLFGKDNFYLELQDHGLKEQAVVNKALVDISRRSGLPLIATNDNHYLDREDANAQDILICIGTNKKKLERERMRFQTDQFYMKSPEEMNALFSEIPEALRNTLAIAERCDLTIDLPGPLLPDYEIPEGFSSPDEYLKHLTLRGLDDRYPGYSEAIANRAEYELSVITSMGFTGYFLIVWDFIHWAHQQHIPVGPGRGSGAGSIVAYALKITDIDPLKYSLLFERFLNPERVSMPDFDIDFCYEGRGQVIDYVTSKYGTDKVGQIITFGTLKSRAVLRDVARVLDLPYAESDSIAKLVPGGIKVTLKDALAQEPKLEEIRKQGGVHEELIDTALRLEGLHRHASTHAAGIVIARTALTDYVPLYRDPKTGSISTQYTMDLLEECGLVKMDFLGLKTLTLIKHTEDLIKKVDPHFDIDKIPEDDKKTFAMLGEGSSTCVFQFESTGMQAVLKKAKPESIEDLIALNALYRPGPMDNIDQFCRAKSGREPINYLLPALEPVLKETYGVIVYQEQVMEIARIVGGYTLGQADILRRAMGKKKEEVMTEEKLRFIEGAIKGGYNIKDAEAIFDLLVPFAGYGFNKSHAAAYSVLAYKTAFLKANYPAEFMAANLTNEINDTEKLREYINEATRMNLKVMPPDINLSEKTFTVNRGNIVYGLIGIKNVGGAAVDAIITERNTAGPFESPVDFLMRVDGKTVNRKVLETLIQTGVFDQFGTPRAMLMYNLDRVLEFVSRSKEFRQYGQASLFDGAEEPVDASPVLEPVTEWPERELLKFEKEMLGFYVSGHPMDAYRSIWEKVRNIDFQNPERSTRGKTYTTLGIITSLREIQTKKGPLMAFLRLEDYTGSMEIVFFPEIWEQYRTKLQADDIIAIRGTLDDRRGTNQLIVEEVMSPEELDCREALEVHIEFENGRYEEDELVALRSLCMDYPGNCRVFLHLPENGNNGRCIIKASDQITTTWNKSLEAELRHLPFVREVWKE